MVQSMGGDGSDPGGAGDDAGQAYKHPRTISLLGRASISHRTGLTNRDHTMQVPHGVRQRQRLSGFVEPRPCQQCSDLDGARAFFEFCFSYSQDGELPANFQRLHWN